MTASDKPSAPSADESRPTYSPAPAALPQDIAAGGGGMIVILGWICALLWLIGAGLVAWAWAPAPGLSSMATPMLTALAAIAIIPALLFGLLGHIAGRVVRAGRQTQALLAAADSLTRPDMAAQTKVTALAQGIRSQINGVDGEFKAALDRLAGMENVLRGHTDALSKSHLAATRQTGDIASRLSEEREGLKQISSSFDERMGALSRLLTEHSDRLAQSTQVAEQKIQEARVSVEGAAAKINASSEIVRENALAATDSLGAGETKIASLGASIREQATSLSDINARHAAEMSDLISRLETEQSRMRETMDARLKEMRDMSISAKLSAESLNEAGVAGKRTIEALAKSANLADSAVRERFKEMEDMVNFSASKAESITDRAAQRVRDSLSLTRLEISRIEDDMRDLEQRLTDRNVDFERRDTAVDVTPKPAWRKSLLRFRPADTEDTPEAEARPAPVTPALTLQPTDPDDVIRAAERPQTLEIPHPNDIRKTVKPPQTEAAPDPEPVKSEETMPAAPDFSLDMETPPADPVLPLDIDPASTLSAARIDPPQLRARKQKSGWSFKSLFGGADAPETPKPQHDDYADWDAQCAAMVSALSSTGLAPGAAVDGGTIIEAVNKRVSEGPDAMRKTVALRLSEPVRHLQGVFAEDADMRMQAEHFATRFYQVISAKDGQREAIRENLESDAGRAFLLCDAALG